MTGRSTWRAGFITVLVLLVAPFLHAQQAGTISGTVRAIDGAALPGVTIEARSTVLPQSRMIVTSGTGDYRLPQLPPGRYALEFVLSGFRTERRDVAVALDQGAVVHVTMGLDTVSETITVVAGETLVDPVSTAITSTVTGEAIIALPVGQEYRDILRLAPAVQLNDGSVNRGPASGGSEQDNVYLFDGVNITLPLFGTLASVPSTHDIADVAVIKGGARAINFNRSAGFTIDSVSKSGTSEWTGVVEYQIMPESMRGKLDAAQQSQFDQDQDWLTFGLGGPILRDRLYVYGSYYRPTVDRTNTSNLYGDVPDYRSVRDEIFGKLTYTPISRLLINASYRDSNRSAENARIDGNESATASKGDASTQTIGILEGSWIISDRSFATFKLNDYAWKTSSHPDLILDVAPSVAPGARLDVSNFAGMGYFYVPTASGGQTSGEAAYNAFVQPIIEQYGYLSNGVRTGGGRVGAAGQTDDQDFFRTSVQAGFDITLGSKVAHDLHIGYQRYTDEEDLARSTNGWGFIEVPGPGFDGAWPNQCPADAGCGDQPYYFMATFQRTVAALAGRQVIHSEFASQNLEVNDTIRWRNWAFNVGALLSNDTIYGQGLREDPSTVSGYVLSPGTKYKLYEVAWDKQIQPRLGVNWAYNGLDTVYASYARYDAAASSLPRAASWDRNSLNLWTEAYFDASGNVIGSRPGGGSSGKIFVQDMDPRYTDEFMIGTSKQIGSNWTARAYARYRYSTDFWEDTNNNSRVDFGAPEGIPHELYIPNLNEMRAQLCQSNRDVCTGTLSGSSYVIAQLDGAFTKYYEATVESDLRAGNLFLRGTYTWSHYYGNFDQDNTFLGYDGANFIGSSYIADGPGRQIWDNRYGDLHADRRHLLKLYGYYRLPWNATAGFFGLFQSGHPWERWSVIPYSNLTSSRSDQSRFDEPAGSRRTADHYQVDLSYTQTFPVRGIDIALVGDVFNVFDRQTGYSPYQACGKTSADGPCNNPLFGVPNVYHSPRRFQLAVRIAF